MTKIEFLNLIKDVDDNEELRFYVWDYEYDEEGIELGRGTVMIFDGDVNIRVN